MRHFTVALVALTAMLFWRGTRCVAVGDDAKPSGPRERKAGVVFSEDFDHFDAKHWDDVGRDTRFRPVQGSPGAGESQFSHPFNARTGWMPVSRGSTAMPVDTFLRYPQPTPISRYRIGGRSEHAGRRRPA
jgi:hypothetical protein